MSVSNTNTDKLIEILEHEAGIYEDILRLSKNKTQFIVDGKVPELESMVKTEQALIVQMRELEEAREKAVEAISEELSAGPETLTVSQIIGAAEGERADRLKACQEAMKKKLEELRGTNELNSRLLQNSLEYIDFSINLIAAADAVGNNYGDRGQADGSKKKNFFDVKL